MKAPDATPVAFPNAAAWRAWLRTHHRTVTAIVLRIAKVHVAASGVTYAEALDEALCHGWIDGIRRALDADGFSVRFTPRRPRSVWSRVNVRHAERLIREGRMTKAGLAAFQAREEERTGVYSFERPPAELGPPLLARLRAVPKAWAHFRAETSGYRRIVSAWVMTAKQEATRLRRLDLLIANSARGERIPSLRRDR